MKIKKCYKFYVKNEFKVACKDENFTNTLTTLNVIYGEDNVTFDTIKKVSLFGG